MPDPTRPAPAHPARPAHVVMVGLMGTGKTTVGRIVADRLGWPFADSDADIEAARDRTVRQLRDELGDEAMHALEARALLDRLRAPGPLIVAAAASVIEDPACRSALLDDGVAVAWLRVSPAVAAARFGSSGHRPAFGPDPETFLAEQAARRDPLFRAVADVVVDTDHADPDEEADAILEALGLARSAPGGRGTPGRAHREGTGRGRGGSEA